MKTFKRVVIVNRNHRNAKDKRKKSLWIVAEYRDGNDIEYRKAFEFDNKAHVEDCNFPLYLD
jgi:hypothetical protein